MTPYYQDDLVTIYHGDCREWMPEADVIVTDPPYGMAYRPASTHVGGLPFDAVVGDDEPFDPAPLIAMNRPTLLWGANFYASRLPDSGGWLCWDKRTVSGLHVRSSECEFAWTNCVASPKVFRWLWSGAFRDGEGRGKHLHPTQKPMELMVWCIEQMPPGTILDPFMGSGSTLVAAKSLGRKSIGIEIEERYCEVAARRCSQEVLGLETPA